MLGSGDRRPPWEYMEYLELVRRGYAAFSAGDVETLSVPPGWQGDELESREVDQPIRPVGHNRGVVGR
jgi:hypothetical protein